MTTPTPRTADRPQAAAQTHTHSHNIWKQPVTDQPLRRDIRMLGFELGHVLRHHGSRELYQLVERVRQLAKNRRAGSDEADDTLRDTIRECSVDELAELARALTCFFDLANLAEDRHRIRVLRQRSGARYPSPRKESPGAALSDLAEAGLTFEQAQDLLNGLTIELVFTAHPTEAKRRTVRNTLRRLRQRLIELDRVDLLPAERDTLIENLKIDLDGLWETDTLRPRKPTVIGEVRRSLFAFGPLWEVIPRLYGGMRKALNKTYPGHAFDVPAFLRFGTWIGGDRDGNPFVTHQVTAETLAMLRVAAITKHIEQGRELFSRLSISTARRGVTSALQASLNDARQRMPEIVDILDHFHPEELYRHALRVIEHRLTATAQADPMQPVPNAAYADASELTADLTILQQSLIEDGHPELANGAIQDWLDRVTVFGFHFACLDVREDAQRLVSTCGEMIEQLALVPRFDELTEEAKQDLLARPLTEQHAAQLDLEALSPETRETLNLFILLHNAGKNYSPAAFGCQIASMTQKPSDVLTFLWLSRVSALIEGDAEPSMKLPIVPLFETIDDLNQAPTTLKGLWANAAYRQHVKDTGDMQVAMVGYSDSTKDGGYLAANAALYKCQATVADLAAEHGIKMCFFHGRGGALGRGGGPAARGILSLPPKAVNGQVRITEQGEVLADRYDDPEIAYRHLEQVTWAAIDITGKLALNTNPTVSSDWLDLMQVATDRSLNAYRNLREHESFLAYFDECTPIRVIESLAIGSRPARRRTQASLANLRAIPYTFSWNQTRHGLTAFYGMGAGLQAAKNKQGGGWETLQTMYQQWPFFAAVIDNAELALVKCDLEIAHAYADLAENPVSAHKVWTLIRDEFQLAKEAVLAITQRTELMSQTSWLDRSIKVRNPYVDPINFIQVELMRRQRNGDDSPELADALRLTVQGIAAGLRTTG